MDSSQSSQTPSTSSSGEQTPQQQYMQVEQEIAELHEHVRTALHNNDFENALKKAQMSRNIVQDHFGKKHAVYAACTNNIALAYKEQGDFDNAIEHYEEAISLYKDLHGENHESTGAAVANAGLLYRRMAETHRGLERTGLLDTSYDYLQRALQIRQKVFQPGSPVIAVTKQHIGGVLRLQKRFKESEAYIKEAIHVLRKKPGVEHRAFATALNSYGILLKDMERFDDAEQFYQQALEIRRKLYGEDHPETIAVEYNISELAAARGDEQTAFAIQSRIAARAGEVAEDDREQEQEQNKEKDSSHSYTSRAEVEVSSSSSKTAATPVDLYDEQKPNKPKTRSEKKKEKVFSPGVPLNESIKRS